MSKYSVRNEKEKTKSEEIGQRLRDLRLKYGKKINQPTLRQGAFAAILGIGGDSQGSRDSLVGRLERGECDIKPSELKKYSQLCGVSIDYIVNGGEYEHADIPTAITLSDLCNEIMRLDKCGMIDFVTHGNRQGILFRDLFDEMRTKDYGVMTFMGADGNPVSIPKEPTTADNDAACYSDTIQQFIANYCAVKDMLAQVGYTKYGRQAADLAEKGALNDLTPFDSYNTVDILYRKEHPVDTEAEFKKLDPIISNGPLPKAGDVITTVNGNKVTVTGITIKQPD